MSEPEEFITAKEVSSGPIQLAKEFKPNEYPVPAVVFTLTNQSPDEQLVQFVDPIGDIEDNDIGFHPQFGAKWWTQHDTKVTFTYVMPPNSEFTTLYGVRVPTDRIKQMDVNPDIEVVTSDITSYDVNDYPVEAESIHTEQEVITSENSEEDNEDTVVGFTRGEGKTQDTTSSEEVNTQTLNEETNSIEKGRDEDASAGAESDGENNGADTAVEEAADASTGAESGVEGNSTEEDGEESGASSDGAESGAEGDSTKDVEEESDADLSGVESGAEVDAEEHDENGGESRTADRTQEESDREPVESGTDIPDEVAGREASQTQLGLDGNASFPRDTTGRKHLESRIQKLEEDTVKLRSYTSSLETLLQQGGDSEDILETIQDIQSVIESHESRLTEIERNVERLNSRVDSLENKQLSISDVENLSSRLEDIEAWKQALQQTLTND